MRTSGLSRMNRPIVHQNQFCTKRPGVFRRAFDDFLRALRKINGYQDCLHPSPIFRSYPILDYACLYPDYKPTVQLEIESKDKQCESAIFIMPSAARSEWNP